MSSSCARPAWQLPLQWPHAGAQHGERRAATSERLVKAAIVFAMLALTVLDRFGLRLTENFSIPPGMIAMYGLAAAMLASGAATLDSRAALGYLLAASAAALSYLVNASFGPWQHITLESLLLLLVLYAPFAVSLRPGAFAPSLWRWTARLYIAFSVFLALAGIAQFFAQFVFRADWLFNYMPLIPAPIRASLEWGTVLQAGGWIKSNGFFLREPSIFSVAMAFGLLCELSTGRRKWVMAVLASGLVLSYSGSGLLCLAVALLFPLGWSTLTRIVAGAAIAATVFFVLGDALNLSYTLNRVNEFASTSEGSSAYCRFIYPGKAAVEQIDSTAWAALLGHGPGTMARMGATCADPHQTTYAKLVFEYGLVGTLAFAVLILGALRRSAVPLRIRAGLGVTWLLIGGNLVTSEIPLALYVLSAMWPRQDARGEA